jgi:hypothetical protein
VATGSAFSNVLKAKEDLQKSPEQLEQEKRSVIAQRVPALHLDGKTKQDLVEKVVFSRQKSCLFTQSHNKIVSRLIVCLFDYQGKRNVCTSSTIARRYLRIN